jgi:hypothetical protein|tara:strand:+ start:1657 stop:1836 length:180 start_codon:yes stop_codon:yes gene_type:complete
MSSYYDILKTLFLKDGAETVIYEIKTTNKRKPRTTGKKNIGIGRGSYSRGNKRTRYGTY